jgi:hypothetical protein
MDKYILQQQKTICPSAKSYLSNASHSKRTISRGGQNTVLIFLYQRCDLDCKLLSQFQTVFYVLLCTNYYRKTGLTFFFDLLTTITMQWCACVGGTIGSFKKLPSIKVTIQYTVRVQCAK